MTPREQYVLFCESMADYVTTLRSLIEDRMERRPYDWRQGLLVSDWRKVRRWYDMLWWFDLEGARSAGFPSSAEMLRRSWCTPVVYGQFLNEVLGPEDLALPVAGDVARDPRYIAFRCSFDWTVLNARQLLGDGDGSAGDIDTQYAKVFTCQLPDPGEGDDYEPQMMCGRPVALLHRNRHTACVGWLNPRWASVSNRHSALAGFLWSGDNSSRQLPSERPMLCDSDAFLAALSRMASSCEPGLFESWPVDNPAAIMADPRCVAFRCGYDHRAAEQAIKMLNSRMTPRDEDLA